ncbi:MAG: B12-binding domain-containing protein, partial [Verrucomicrobiae bacterium]|nr:B12-binding domain-containing protein [Verrucomicrobiae bacterium]
HFREAKSRTKKKVSELSLDERLARYIVEGTKDGLIADLELKLKEADPLSIINGPLMAGMDEVGRLFNNNELIVAEVLQSAEVMKAAVAYLEKFMEKKTDATKGKIILATVKGDVHDIGKNLVEIILANNGYQVINLGIKVPPEEIIRAYHEHRPDAIGLSGLLVKSAQQMVVTATDLREAGITVPLLVGGAALSDKFTRTKIAPSYQRIVIYCRDAMAGLNVMNRLMDPAEREKIAREFDKEARADAVESKTTAPALVPAQRSQRVRLIPPLAAPYADRKVRTVPLLREVWEYINPQMLYVRHLGFKGNFERALAQRDPKALELYDVVETIKTEAAQFMKIRVVWQFFDVESDGNSIRVYPAHAPRDAAPLHQFTFPRQPVANGLCLADYVMPPEQVGDRYVRDSIAMFVTTAGEGIRERSAEYKNRGEFLKSHALQALAIETAEAAAEWLHRRIREDWGFPDPQELTMLERFQARYRGKRYSFGYPACPSLEDQTGIWKLLRPEEIGVHLTEGFMMDPEASVSAL